MLIVKPYSVPACATDEAPAALANISNEAVNTETENLSALIQYRTVWCLPDLPWPSRYARPGASPPSCKVWQAVPSLWRSAFPFLRCAGWAAVMSSSWPRAERSARTSLPTRRQQAHRRHSRSTMPSSRCLPAATAPDREGCHGRNRQPPALLQARRQMRQHRDTRQGSCASDTGHWRPSTG